MNFSLIFYNVFFLGLTWILRWFGNAIGEWITGESFGASATGYVVDDGASRGESTRSRARVTALLIYTSHVTRAIGIDGTLWSTVGWNTDVSVHATAGVRVSNCSTDGIRAAR